MAAASGTRLLRCGFCSTEFLKCSNRWHRGFFTNNCFRQGNALSRNVHSAIFARDLQPAGQRASILPRRYVRPWKKQKQQMQMMKDNKANLAKSARVLGLSRTIRGAVYAAHGETDPKKNKELEKALQEYSDVGPEYIQRALANVKVIAVDVKQALQLKSCYFLKSLTDPTSIFVQTKSGIKFVVDGYAGVRPAVIKDLFKSTLRKMKYPAEIVDVDPAFEKKGVILVDLPIDDKTPTEEEATNIAIEVGAEDVFHDGDQLKFICGEKDWIDPQKALVELGMKPASAGVEFVPVEGDVFTERDITDYQNAVDKLQHRVQDVGLKFMITQIEDNISGIQEEPS